MLFFVLLSFSDTYFVTELISNIIFYDMFIGLEPSLLVFYTSTKIEFRDLKYFTMCYGIIYSECPFG